MEEWHILLKAKGYEIGDSLCEEDKLEEAKRIMDKAEESGVKLTLSRRHSSNSKAKRRRRNRLYNIFKNSTR